MRSFVGAYALVVVSLLACSNRTPPALATQRDGRSPPAMTEDGSSAGDKATTSGETATQAPGRDDSVSTGADSLDGDSDVVVTPVNPTPPTPRDGFDCSPRAEYEVSPQRVAQALARILWNSEPDAELLAIVEAGELATVEDARKQAERMIADPRAVRRLGALTQWWLEMEHYSSEGYINAKSQYDPAYTAQTYRAIAEETRLFTEDLLSNPDATLSDFLTSRRSFVNADLSPYYGLDVATPEFVAVTLPAERSGVLTQLQFLGRAQLSQTNPPMRGYFTLEKLLCVDVGVPSPDVVLPPERLPGMTTRQYFEAYYSDPSCRPCHDYGVVLGYAFENFDAFGRLRTEEDGVPVDTSNWVQALDDEPKFADAPSLLRDLARREPVHECLTKHWLAFLLNRESANGYSTFSQFELSPATCPNGSSGSGSGVPCLPAVTLSDRMVDESECSRFRGELYLLDVVLSLATSKSLVEGSFECGPLTCLRDWEYCYRVRDASSDDASGGGNAPSSDAPSGDARSSETRSSDAPSGDAGPISDTAGENDDVRYRYGCEPLRQGCKERDGCTCTTDPDGATTMTCE